MSTLTIKFHKTIFPMQKDQNTQNKNIHQPVTENIKPYKILKCKGKPFWLNLSANRNKNYQKFKNQLNPQSSFIASKTEQTTTVQQHQNQVFRKQSCLQSVQSFNQNYDEDFKSYKSTINESTIKTIKKQVHKKKSISNNKLDFKISQLQSSLLKTPQRKVNLSSLSKVKTQIIPKRLIKSRIKTQKNPCSETTEISKLIFMNQSTIFLQNQNEKMIRKIQQLRKLLPMMMKNIQQINQQRSQINKLKDIVKRAISPCYELELQKSRQKLTIDQKLIEQTIRKLNSPKICTKTPKILINLHYNMVKPEQRVRQQLLCKLRLYTLRQQKSLQLDRKIHLYQEIIEKMSKKQNVESFSNLQRRKIFLQWDIQRMKNDYDIKILSENLLINELKEQAQLFSQQILQKQAQILRAHQEAQRKKQISQKIQISLKQSPVKKIHLKIDQLPVMMSPKKQEISQRNRKKQLSFFDNLPDTDKKTIFTQKMQKQKRILSLNQKSLPQIRENKSTLFPKSQNLKKVKQKNVSNINLNIRIKKAAFQNANLNQDLQELVL